MKTKITHRLLKSLKATGAGYDVNDTELPGFALRVSAEGKPTSYTVRYRTSNGRRQRLKIGTPSVLTPVQARDEARKALADVTRGDDPQNVKKRLRGIQTLGGFVEDEYAPNVLALHKSGQGTLRRLRSRFTKFWHRPLSDRKLREELVAWRVRRVEGGASKTTVNRDIAALRSVFSHAVRIQLLGENPLAGIQQFKTDTLAVIRYLSDGEEERLMAALDAREGRMRGERGSANAWRAKYGYDLLPDLRAVPFADHLKPMVLLSLHTGVRRGELFSIEWRDVDSEMEVLTIRGDIAKNGRTRHVPLNAVALAILREWQAQTKVQGLVFKSPRGGRFNNVDAAWRNLMEAAGISDFRWHDIRHDFASKLVMAGVDLNTVRELLGHGDIKMTLRYAHLAPNAKAAAVARLAQRHKKGKDT